MSKISPITWQRKKIGHNLPRRRVFIASSGLTNGVNGLSLSKKRETPPRGVSYFQPDAVLPENSVALYVEIIPKHSPPNRYLGTSELKALGPNPPASRLAGRLAMKEAILKHLGVPENKRSELYRSIGSFNDPTGKPHLTFDRRLRKLLRREKIHSILHSISHTERLALAYVESRVDTAGVGCDVELIKKMFTNIVDEATFLNHLFTPRERKIVEELSKGQNQFYRRALYTRLWAGKEALAKALGTGLEYPTGIAQHDIEILLHRDANGKIFTTVELDKYKREKRKRPKICTQLLKNLGAGHVEIITYHRRQHAAAWVRLVLKGKPLEMAQQASKITPTHIRKKGEQRPRVTMVFADCVGIGERDPSINPFAAIQRNTRSSAILSHFLDDFDTGQQTKKMRLESLPAPLHVVPLKVTSPNVPGFPASNTNQVTLYTGVDIAKILGQYADGFPDHRTIGVLTRDNILRHLKRMGVDVYSANAYPPWFLGDMWRRNMFTTVAQGLMRFKNTAECRRIIFKCENARDIMRDKDEVWPPEITIGPGSPLNSSAYMIRSIGQEPPSIQDVIDGKALFNGMSTDRYLESLDFSPWGYPNDTITDRRFADAGRVLANISRKHDFTLFSTTITDWASHKDTRQGEISVGLWIAVGLGRFLHSLMESINPENSLVILATDHGGLEDIRTGHTKNPGLFLAYGKHASQVAANVRLLTDVVPTVMGLFS